jgi:hypothetical protein
MGVPMWIGDPALAGGINDVGNTRAVAAGLTLRPTIETIRETLVWDIARGGPAPPLLAPGVTRMPRGWHADGTRMPRVRTRMVAVRRPRGGRRTDGRVRSRRRGDPAAREDSWSIYEGHRAYEPFPA